MELKLDDNRLETLPYGCFEDLSNLQMLDLSDNRLGEFPVGAVVHLKKLDVFDLSKNMIKGIETLRETLDSLRLQDVSFNEILHMNVLVSYPNLEILQFNGNN